MAAPDQWVPHSAVGVLDRVTLRMHWYGSLATLREALSEHDLKPRNLHGFSILRRNTATGEYVCDVYVVRMGGALVDGARTVTLGHEVLHCFGMSHDDSGSRSRLSR
jgi:hypothetical protein